MSIKLEKQKKYSNMNHACNLKISSSYNKNVFKIKK